MANLPQKLTFDQLQTKWASQINPVLSNLLVQGQLLQNQMLITGSNAINHKLGRTPNGWFVVSPQSAAVVHQNAYQPNSDLILTLTSSGSLTCDLWVF
jgi:hypothetical protein